MGLCLKNIKMTDMELFLLQVFLPRRHETSRNRDRRKVGRYGTRDSKKARTQRRTSPAPSYVGYCLGIYGPAILDPGLPVSNFPYEAAWVG